VNRRLPTCGYVAVTKLCIASNPAWVQVDNLHVPYAPTAANALWTCSSDAKSAL